MNPFSILKNFISTHRPAIPTMRQRIYLRLYTTALNGETYVIFKKLIKIIFEIIKFRGFFAS